MAGMNKIETYLVDIDVSYEEISDNFFLVNDEERGLPGIQINFEDPIVIMRANVMPIPEKNHAEVYEQLLKFNASDMVHGAYGIDDGNVILIDTLEYETMDKEEFEAALDSIGMALSRHYNVLAKYRN